jgi:hypothetical protein
MSYIFWNISTINLIIASSSVTAAAAEIESYVIINCVKVRLLVAGFPSRWSRYEPRSGHVRFVTRIGTAAGLGGGLLSPLQIPIPAKYYLIILQYIVLVQTAPLKTNI